MEEIPQQRMTRRERFFLVLAVLLSLCLLAACFLVPLLMRGENGSGTEGAVEEGGELGGILLQSDAFLEARELVVDNYVEKVEGEELLLAAETGIRRLAREGAPEDALVERGIEAMVDSLDDPFSSYMSREEVEMLDTQLSGHLSGIGVAMQAVKNEIRVVEVLEGTPAQEAGLLEGDVVREVDGVDVTGMDLEEVVMMIRGPEGTSVRLGIVRPPSRELLHFDIVRRDIEIPVMETEMKGEVGYLRLTDWTADASDKMAEALGELRGSGAAALVIDLRNNPGGYMEPAIKAADLFLEGGTIVTSRGRVAGSSKEYEAEPGVEWDLPVVILVNRGTASSSEIFASALRDNDRCLLVGETTFGKGSIQQLFRQGDGTALRITIARYFTPRGKSIDEEGIEPDYKVKNPVLGQEDLQLQKALEVAGGSF